MNIIIKKTSVKKITKKKSFYDFDDLPDITSVVKKNHNEAKKIYENIINTYNNKNHGSKKVIHALNKLAHMYIHSKYIKKDYNKAFELYSFSAKKGCFYAVNKLGEMCQCGYG